VADADAAKAAQAISGTKPKSAATDEPMPKLELKSIESSSNGAASGLESAPPLPQLPSVQEPK